MGTSSTNQAKSREMIDENWDRVGVHLALISTRVTPLQCYIFPLWRLTCGTESIDFRWSVRTFACVTGACIKQNARNNGATRGRLERTIPKQYKLFSFYWASSPLYLLKKVRELNITFNFELFLWLLLPCKFEILVIFFLFLPVIFILCGKMYK